jgi:hypothetical protein
MVKRVSRWVAALAVCALAACGGGGDGAGASGFGGSSGGGSSGGTGGGTGDSVAEYKVTLQLSNSTVTASTPATVTARVENLGGVPQPNVVVNFKTADQRGALSAPSALTDASGRANVTLSPASGVTSGADTLSAEVDLGGGKLAKASIGFQLTATNVTIASFTSDVSTLAAYGQTGISVQLANATTGTPVSVSVTSSCVTKGRASLTPSSFTTSTGVATFTFRDQGCGAFDAIDGLQASVAGTAATANLQLTLTAPLVSSVSFVSAEPQEIYLKGSGFVENSNVTFQLRDANGAGVPNQAVVLEPTTLAGGLLIDGGSVPVVKRTDTDGKVIVRINSGTVPTPVRVKATLEGSGISTVSSSLAVAVGLPAQNNFSLSAHRHNIEGYDIDGTSNTYTIIASDRLANPVPSGTAINFVAEGGQIQAIKQTVTSNGLSSATANFQSSSPRPLDGRITILAYALGEESFLDGNGNNVYDLGEDHQDLGDVFLDRLLNGTYNAIEDQFISLSIAGTDACNVATSTLLRLDRSMPSRATSQTGQSLSTCVTGWGRAYVRRSAETVLSTSAARPLYGTVLPAGAKVPAGSSCPTTISLITDYSGTNDTANRTSYYPFGSVTLTNLEKSGVITFVASDNNPVAFNPMAAGTEITVKSTTGIAVEVVGGTPVPSTLTPTGVGVAYSFDSAASSGVITVNFKSPSGLLTSVNQPIVYKVSDTSSMTPCP